MREKARARQKEYDNPETEGTRQWERCFWSGDRLLNGKTLTGCLGKLTFIVSSMESAECVSVCKGLETVSVHLFDVIAIKSLPVYFQVKTSKTKWNCISRAEQQLFLSWNEILILQSTKAVYWKTTPLLLHDTFTWDSSWKCLNLTVLVSFDHLHHQDESKYLYMLEHPFVAIP